MDEATFLALTFDAALARAEGAAVDYQEEHASAEGREVYVWYANRLLVQYGADHLPRAVQLCGTLARLVPPHDAPSRPTRPAQAEAPAELVQRTPADLATRHPRRVLSWTVNAPCPHKPALLTVSLQGLPPVHDDVKGNL